MAIRFPSIVLALAAVDTSKVSGKSGIYYIYRKVHSYFSGAFKNTLRHTLDRIGKIGVVLEESILQFESVGIGIPMVRSRGVHP